MAELFRRRVIQLLVGREFLNEDPDELGRQTRR